MANIHVDSARGQGNLITLQKKIRRYHIIFFAWYTGLLINISYLWFLTNALFAFLLDLQLNHQKVSVNNYMFFFQSFEWVKIISWAIQKNDTKQSKFVNKFVIKLELVNDHAMFMNIRREKYGTFVPCFFLSISFYRTLSYCTFSALRD